MIAPSRVDPGSLPGAEERTMLRDSMRGFLETHWPEAEAIERGRDRDALVAAWARLVEQGLVSLGSDPTEGGLREATIVMEELGRAACPWSASTSPMSRSTSTPATCSMISADCGTSIALL